MDYRSPFPWRRQYFQPSVPWNMQFFSDYLLHGAYWHDQFGTRRSAGCVNLNLDDARWIYQWAREGMPVIVR
ncbi:MAG: L,D-transpeptidase [Candidatus Blackburnbacteria bacterium]|nr:L,D-transpeptidase [Candidatus Blackburnbacteria bacterium]